MTRYLLRVYRGSAYYPDRKLQSTSRGRLERRARQLEREGVRVRMLAVGEDGQRRWAPPSRASAWWGLPMSPTASYCASTCAGKSGSIPERRSAKGAGWVGGHGRR